MSHTNPISRRLMLKGLGCTIALPWLESARVLAGDSPAAKPTPPKRFACLFQGDGISPNHYVRAIREDTVREKMLYLGTEHGIYVSFDDGGHWRSLNQNLPDTPVHDIKVEARDLVIATHGRGFYVMDNLSPLRQWVDEDPAPLHLFKPQDALRGLDQSLAIDYGLKAPDPHRPTAGAARGCP